MPGNYVKLDASQLADVMRSQMIGPDEVYRRAAVDARSGRRVLEGERVWWSTARKVLSALGVTDFSQFIHVDDHQARAENSLARQVAESHLIGNWELMGPSSEILTTTNDLSYQVFPLRHRHVRGRLGRGKKYLLQDQAERTLQQVRESLLRHPNTCAAVGPHPQIPICWDTFPDPHENAWWVIDDWFDGETLQELLIPEQPFAKLRLADIMRHVAEGLQALHTAGIVRRELSPRFVLVSQPDDHVLLTEFELAKMLDHSPTVSTGWPEDSYRAPEIAGGHVTPAADIYSWGRIFVQVATGKLPSRGKEKTSLKPLTLPQQLQEVVLQALHPLPTKRPQTIPELLAALGRWG